ncbi:MAG: shikimate kinase AroK, partial [Candidatus Lightella neohaematopini]|nr:shikimate kinase AroK [Candidatus Lightella neohaematopini]
KRNIFLIGPMFSGKTTIGFYLAKKLNMLFFDSDYEIQNFTKTSIEKIFIEGEDKFRKIEENIILNIIRMNNILLSTGGGSIKSRILLKYLPLYGNIIYLKTSVKSQLLRINNTTNRPLLKLDNPKIILEYLSSKRNHLYESISDFIISTDKKNIYDIINNIIKLINL